MSKCPQGKSSGITDLRLFPVISPVVLYFFPTVRYENRMQYYSIGFIIFISIGKLISKFLCVTSLLTILEKHSNIFLQIKCLLCEELPLKLLKYFPEKCFSSHEYSLLKAQPFHTWLF